MYSFGAKPTALRVSLVGTWSTGHEDLLQGMCRAPNGRSYGQGPVLFAVGNVGMELVSTSHKESKCLNRIADAMGHGWRHWPTRPEQCCMALHRKLTSLLILNISSKAKSGTGGFSAMAGSALQGAPHQRGSDNYSVSCQANRNTRLFECLKMTEWMGGLTNMSCPSWDKPLLSRKALAARVLPLSEI